MDSSSYKIPKHYYSGVMRKLQKMSSLLWESPATSSSEKFFEEPTITVSSYFDSSLDPKQFYRRSLPDTVIKIDDGGERFAESSMEFKVPYATTQEESRSSENLYVKLQYSKDTDTWLARIS